MNLPAQSTAIPEIVTIAKADEISPRHSEATIVELADGLLMIAWQQFKGSDLGSGDDAPNHIATMQSHDGGRTWSDYRMLVEPSVGDVNVYSPSFVRDAQGDLILLYFHYNALVEGRPPRTSGYLRRSRDEGRTFDEPQPVWKNQPWSCASSVVKRLSTDRLLLPICQQTGAVWSETDHEISGSLFSDDDGEHWQCCKTWADLPLRGAMEPHLAELSDGRLMMVMRTQLGSVFRAHSSDAGLTWSKPQTTGLHCPESCPELINLPDGRLLIVWNNSPYDPGFYSHFGKRSPLTVATSHDDGRTWSRPRDIEADPRRAYANPACTVTQAGQVILHYWSAPYDNVWSFDGLMDLKATIFDLDWLD